MQNSDDTNGGAAGLFAYVTVPVIVTERVLPRVSPLVYQATHKEVAGAWDA
jgi:hypothetical protein